MSPAHDITELVADMSNGDLLRAARAARDDLTEAATDEPNSEWHQACFAAVVIYAAELQERGLSLATKH